MNLLTTSDTNLGAGSLGVPHRFRITWNASSIVYSIDGTVVATHSRTISSTMKLLASDANVDASSLAVDWMRLSPYPSSGTFTSRVIDAGAAVSWGTVTWTADVPTGSAVTIQVRTGDTAVPDGTWSALTAVAAGGSVGRTGRYAQYRATLTRATDGSTPALRDLTLSASP